MEEGSEGDLFFKKGWDGLPQIQGFMGKKFSTFLGFPCDSWVGFPFLSHDPFRFPLLSL